MPDGESTRSSSCFLPEAFGFDKYYTGRSPGSHPVVGSSRPGPDSYQGETVTYEGYNAFRCLQ